jgi:hypothetical protein
MAEPSPVAEPVTMITESLRFILLLDGRANGYERLFFYLESRLEIFLRVGKKSYPALVYESRRVYYCTRCFAADAVYLKTDDSLCVAVIY